MKASQEDIALWVIVAQGFFVMYFECAVWWIKHSDRRDRKAWRDAKRVAVVKKLEAATKLPEAKEEKTDGGQ